jgi:hypothetical protein
MLDGTPVHSRHQSRTFELPAESCAAAGIDEVEARSRG